MVKYVGEADSKDLPTEWLMWLRRTRAHPPTEEDVARGDAQRELSARRVKALEAEDARQRMRERVARAAGEPELQPVVQQLTERGLGGSSGSGGG